MPTIRVLLVSGILCAALGAGGMFPAIVGWLARGALQREGFLALEIGVVLVVGGFGIMCGALRTRRLYLQERQLSAT